MAIRVIKNWKSHGTNWRSGHFYTFRYNAYRQDPNPVIILMYKIEGIHPNTGHQHRYLQAINLSYIPRQQRKAFVSLWLSEMDKNKGNVEFTWDVVQFRFPYLDLAVRRYMTKPVYRIQNPQYIPPENVEDVVVSSWGKDFSKKLEMDLAAKKSRSLGRGEALKKKYRNKWGGFGSSFFGFAKRLFNR